MSVDPIVPVVALGVSESPLPIVTAALIGAGLPAESAARFGEVAVDAMRMWMWEVAAGDVNRLLGGDGGRSPEEERAGLAHTAAGLLEQYGDEVYREVFAPLFVRLLQRVDAHAAVGA
jgi:hypothetical protein